MNEARIIRQSVHLGAFLFVYCGTLCAAALVSVSPAGGEDGIMDPLRRSTSEGSLQMHEAVCPPALAKDAMQDFTVLRMQERHGASHHYKMRDYTVYLDVHLFTSVPSTDFQPETTVHLSANLA